LPRCVNINLQQNGEQNEILFNRPDIADRDFRNNLHIYFVGVLEMTDADYSKYMTVTMTDKTINVGGASWDTVAVSISIKPVYIKIRRIDADIADAMHRASYGMTDHLIDIMAECDCEFAEIKRRIRNEALSEAIAYLRVDCRSMAVESSDEASELLENLVEGEM